ncbi:arsenate-mycothiol transferase ArsC [Tenacibaculum sp. M341]|uniref:arsenate-mycothiol transferase ArsC n=1 Tax=Tenacibaculum sp. M341 TaxID=2530339 RepID=UPI00104695FC|nr:protein-tyrosine-phosphatase [Tenacibaculum sp. M341]TCI90325.1 protein-tyrosine-phosphatase [Tenacibaculum sp. M341]
MKQELIETIKHIATLPIHEDRKKTLDTLSIYIKEKLEKKEAISVNFICTHNSRRSHLGQIWMQTLAKYFNIDNLNAYSGGTEETAVAPQIIDTLKKQNFEVEKISHEKNPVYSIKFDDHSHPIVGFSKKYAHQFNPSTNFAAIMTCSQADEGCPFVAGSEKRIPITYEDPKISDNTDLETETYLERSNQIASELYYVLSQLN